jgi:hypothetical protein
LIVSFILAAPPRLLYIFPKILKEKVDKEKPDSISNGCVKAKIIICTLLICAEGTKTPAGERGWGDPTGAKAPRRLPGPPAESEVPGA